MSDSTRSEREIYRFGPFRLDCALRRLTRDGEPVALAPKPYELLLMLVRNADRAVPRTELLETVWRDTIVEEGSLGWNMSALRKALGDDDGTIIETVRGYGYHLAMAVERESGEEPPRNEREPGPESSAPEASDSARISPAEAAESSAGTIDPPAHRPVQRPFTSPFVRKLVLVAGAALAFAGGALVWLGRPALDGSAPIASARTESARPALAVMPFENLSGSAEHAWLATALAEMLGSELAIGGGTTTIAGESVARVAADLGVRAGAGLAGETIARLRARLGFDQIVVGTYLLVGAPETLRVDLALQDAASGEKRLAWSESRPLAELPDLVAAAGRELRGRFASASVAAPVSARAFAGSTEALRAYAEAIELRRGFQLGAARARLERTLELAPDLVLARAELAELLAELGYLARAIDESRRALAGAGSLAPIERLPIEARSRELEGRWAEAAELWRQSLALSPDSFELALASARSLSRAGRHDESRALLDRLARRPAPVGSDPRIVLQRGWTERFAQRFEAMEAAGIAGVALGRALPSEYVLAEALSIVGWADLTLGRHPPGLAACEEGQRVAAKIGHARLETLHASLCGWIELNSGNEAKAEASFRQFARMAEANGDAVYAAGAHNALGWLHLGRGELAAAERESTRALELARGAGDLERIVNGLDLAAAHLHAAARLDEAERAAIEGVAKARAINIASRISILLGHLGRIRLARGDVAGALAAHEEAVAFPTDAAPGRVAPRELDLARSRLAARDHAGALASIAAAELRLAAAAPTHAQRLEVELLRARVQLAQGDAASARAALARVEATGLALADELALDRAELLTALGDGERAAAAWRALGGGPGRVELRLRRLTAELRLAELEARRAPGPESSARLEALRSRARAARAGALVGEKL